MSDRIGVLGQGFVGGAVTVGMSPYYDVQTFDTQKDSTCESLEQLVDRSDVIFVCLPTPMRRDGSCDTRIVDGALADIRDLCRDKGYDNRVAVVKSTVEPGSTVEWNRKFNPHLTVVFNPEFLTEANHIEDFKNQNRIILGGPRPETGRVKTLFRKAFPTATIVKTGSTEAETVKYFTNCFLATKVAFANEMYQLCNSLDIDYDKVVEYALYDQRIGNSHLSVPGPDGSMGFGGHCVKGETTIRSSLGNVAIQELCDLFAFNPEYIRNSVRVQSMNHDGTEVETKNISNMVRNDYSGKMLKITFGENQFECTSDHLLPILRNGKQLLVKAKDLLIGDEVFVVD